MLKSAGAIRYIVLIVACLLVFSSCTAADPYPEDMWTQNIYPGVTNIYDLGSPTLEWDEIYANTGIFSGNFTFGGCVDSNLVPCANVTYDLGSPFLYWDDLYVDTVHAGTLIGGNVTDVVAATFVVAASNSVDPDRADYQCDGVVDDVQINAALVACPATGGRVMLLEGDYYTAQNILVPLGCTLEGQGWNTIINSNGAAVTNAIVANGTDAQIKNLKVIISAGCGAPGSRPNIIYSIGQTTITLDNLYLYGDKTVASDVNVNRQNGILLSNVDGSHVRNCLVTNNHYYGISLANDCDFTFVRGNLSYGNLDGISLHTCTGNTIISNTCLLNSEVGIHLASSTQSSIQGNIVSNNLRQGIYCFFSSENAFEGNVARDNAWHGIQISSGTSNSMTGNTATDNTLTGIILSSSNSTSIVGNTCNTNGAYGIYLTLSSYCTITGNGCDGQVANHGLYIYRSDYCSIAGNICNNNNLDGINITGDGTANSDYNTIIGSVCYNNGDDGLELAGGTDCNYNVVSGNQLINNVGTDYVDNGNQTEYWGGSTPSYLELRPDLDFTTITAQGKPTQVIRGIYHGYSLPIYGADNEELFFDVCVPNRWDRESDILIYVDCYIDTANANKNFNLQLDWEHYTPVIDVVPNTFNTITVETNTGAGAQFQSYRVEFIVDYDIDVGDDIEIDDNLAFRLIRIAATANEMAGEPVILHLGVIFQRNKVGEPVP